MDEKDSSTIYISDDDDCLDDPMMLLDMEEQAVFYGTGTKVHVGIYNSSDHEVRLKELLAQMKETPKECESSSYFCNSDVLKCRPCSVKIVDCHKHPWFYQNEFKVNHDIIDTEEEEIINDDDDIELVEPYLGNKSNKGFVLYVRKNKITVDTDKRIQLNGNNNYNDEKVCKDNFAVEKDPVQIDVQRRNIVRRERNINDDKQLSLKCNKSKTKNIINESNISDCRTNDKDVERKSRPLSKYKKSKIETMTLSTDKLKDYWRNFNPQNIDENIINDLEGKISYQNVIKHKCNECNINAKTTNHSNHKRQAKQPERNNRLKSNDNKKSSIKKQLNHKYNKEKHTEWRAPPLTNKMSSKTMNGRLHNHYYYPDKRNDRQTEFYNSKRIPHHQPYSWLGEVECGRKGIIETNKDKYDNNMTDRLRYGESIKSLYCGAIPEMHKNDNTDDDCVIVDKYNMNTVDINNVRAKDIFDAPVDNNNRLPVHTYRYNIYNNIETGYSYSQNKISNSNKINQAQNISAGPKQIETYLNSYRNFMSRLDKGRLNNGFLSNRYNNSEMFGLNNSNKINQAQDISAGPKQVETYLNPYRNYLLRDPLNNRFFSIRYNNSEMFGLKNSTLVTSGTNLEGITPSNASQHLYPELSNVYD